MDGINWYYVNISILYLFSIYFEKRISRMPASCTIRCHNAIQQYLYTLLLLLYMYSVVEYRWIARSGTTEEDFWSQRNIVHSPLHNHHHHHYNSLLSINNAL